MGWASPPGNISSPAELRTFISFLSQSPASPPISFNCGLALSLLPLTATHLLHLVAHTLPECKYRAIEAKDLD